MASTSNTNPDMLVTLKINLEGNNRRFKLPLRDLGANTLPDKLRFLLAIPPSAETIFERYSDSAAAFIVLDPNNASVYKQLYRAAKAKLKLRLKVTVIEKEPAETEPIVPKPATVEDEPAPVSPVSSMEAAPAVSQTFGESSTTVNETPTQDNVSETTVYGSVAENQRDLGQYSGSVAEIQRGLEELLIARRDSSKAQPSTSAPSCCGAQPTSFPSCPHREAARMNDCSGTEIPVTRKTTARDKFLAELAGLSTEGSAALRGLVPDPFHHKVPVFSVFCNNCQSAIPDVHYHCSTCDSGDFDLCQACVDKGVVCGSEEHWMIKRFFKNGKVINSTTERIAPKAKEPVLTVTPTAFQAQDSGLMIATRTCNCCVQKLTEEHFVTCTSCPDYDLCITCHVENEHGHHPKHAFEPAVKDTNLDVVAQTLLAPGRNIGHNAICDGCDKYIYGVRHKCLDCPDWDFCAACIANANFIHPRHRFVPIYEPLNDLLALSRSYHSKARHHGIYCDGPLCNSGKSIQTYIKGDRYKCAVCHDTDFCASCEASPSNLHNRTHPLIKFKTPVRNVSVTTVGDHEDGRTMPVMGDQNQTRRGRTTSKATETTPLQSTNAATQVQTVADLQPTEPVKAEKVPEIKAEEAKELPAAALPAAALPAAAVKEDLVAHFVKDVVADGTIMAPNTVFEQTWYLRNGGNTTWPAGCTVKFVSGDNMCSVDPDHPASVHELVSAAESTTCYAEVAPGQEVGFTARLRTPKRTGTCISYWRLTGPDGNKFGHRLWCDVSVQEPEVQEEPKVKEEPKQVEAEVPGTVKSQMIFPKLEKESPTTSFYDHAPIVTETEVEAEELDEFEDFADEALEDDETEDGFMTDEEYDILDASDEECFAEQVKTAKK